MNNQDNTIRKVYIVEDPSGQGYAGRGIIYVGTDEQKTKDFVGKEWYTITEVETDREYPKGIYKT